MKKLCFILILTKAIFLAGLCFAEGGPPLITDDPDTPGDHHWEINIALTLNSTAQGQTFELPHFDVNYGLGDHIQLKWESGVAVVSQTGTSTQGGWEDSLFGVKWKFIDGGENGISVGTYPQLGVRLLSSSNPNISGPTTYFMLPVEIKKGWGNFTLDGEVGAVFAQGSTNGWMYGVCAGYNLTKRIELLGEVHGQVNGTTGASLLFPPGVIAQLGAIIGFNDTIAVILSAGYTVIVPSGAAATTLFYSGVKLTL